MNKYNLPLLVLGCLLLLTGCLSVPHGGGGGGTSPSSGDPSDPASPFGSLISTLRIIGVACLFGGVGTLVAGCSVIALSWIRSLGATLLAAGLGCFLAAALLNHFGSWLIWGGLIAVGVLAAPAFVYTFRYMQRRFGVDLEPGPGPGPGPGDHRDSESSPSVRPSTSESH